MKSRTCCFTGHRQIPLEEQAEIKDRLECVTVSLYQRGIRCYEAGGALGFDTLAAQTVLKLRKVYPDIELILVLPCLTQTKRWRLEDVEEYERIKAQADKVIYTSQDYTRGCMFKRNRHLVVDSSVRICYLTRSSGGTAYTVRYAKAQGREVVNIA